MWVARGGSGRPRELGRVLTSANGDRGWEHARRCTMDASGILPACGGVAAIRNARAKGGHRGVVLILANPMRDFAAPMVGRRWWLHVAWWKGHNGGLWRARTRERLRGGRDRHQRDAHLRAKHENWLSLMETWQRGRSATVAHLHAAAMAARLGLGF